jgi:hypothetical protein
LQRFLRAKYPLIPGLGRVSPAADPAIAQHEDLVRALQVAEFLRGLSRATEYVGLVVDGRVWWIARGSELSVGRLGELPWPENPSRAILVHTHVNREPTAGPGDHSPVGGKGVPNLGIDRFGSTHLTESVFYTDSRNRFIQSRISPSGIRVSTEWLVN